MFVLSIFVLTLLLSASLLFSIQPVFTKMVLPLLGGSPAVWNTSMVFYQAMLLLGYLYAHFSIKWLSRKVQPVVHIALVLLAVATLPILLPEGLAPPAGENPSLWLIGILFITVGPSFFIISSTAPMLQKWFTHTSHPSAKDPYFLYAASNIGSIGALLAYPFLAEPLLTLKEQSWTWTFGYALLILFIIASGAALFRSKAGAGEEGEIDAEEILLSPPVRRDVTHSHRIWWVLLAFAPSSLLLGVTNYISTDIASVPLLWIIPLVLYLLTFVIVFARRPVLPHGFMVRAQPFVILPIAMLFMTGPFLGKWVNLNLHLIAFFVTAMVCHGELVKSRPEAGRLTEFYIWLSLGGILGGAFNALLAPVLFNSIVEYPLVIALACLLRPRPDAASTARNRLYDFALPVIMLLALVAIQPFFEGYIPKDIKSGDIKATTYGSLVVVFAVAVVCYLFRKRPVRFGLALGAIIMAGTMFWFSSKGQILYQERSFFGVHKVSLTFEGRIHVLQHGTTFHGAQAVVEGFRHIPTAYYHRAGPIGETFERLYERDGGLRVAAIGLGAGTLAAYARQGDNWTFYEIDPAVVRIASTPALFSYLTDAKGKIEIKVGDARLKIAEAEEGEYDLIVVDAFSSDSIPVHLVTREAVELYASKLAKDGIIAFHVSNKYLSLRPVLDRVAIDRGLYSVSKQRGVEKESEKRFMLASEWVFMSRSEAQMKNLASSGGWVWLNKANDMRLWTDDYSNILSVLR